MTAPLSSPLSRPGKALLLTAAACALATPAAAGSLTSPQQQAVPARATAAAALAKDKAVVVPTLAVAAADAAPSIPPRQIRQSDSELPPATFTPPDVRAQASDFVQSFAGTLWNHDPICIRVAGGEPGKAALVKARVDADARAAGLSVKRACTVDETHVEIRLAADAERAVREVLDKYPEHPVWPFPLEKPTGADRPIRAWYRLVYDHSGAPAWARRESPLTPGADPGAPKRLAMAIVVIDPRRVAGKSLDAVSDYAALLALSQPRALDRCNVLPSITDLFAGACPGRPEPTVLTTADSAYLKALYAGSEGIRATRTQPELIDAMAKRLTNARVSSR